MPLFNNCGPAFQTSSKTLVSETVFSNEDSSFLPINVGCDIYLEQTYSFSKDVSPEDCETYCERVRSGEACVAVPQGETPTFDSTPQDPPPRAMTEDENAVVNRTALPAGYGWTKLYDHPTIGITQEWLTKNENVAVNGVLTRKRGQIVENAPGEGGRAFLHTVKTTDIVEPFRFESPPIVRDNSLDNAYLMRFKHYVTAYSGVPGKLIEFEGGRGYVATRYRHNDTELRGTGGWGANVMHPRTGTTNFYRLLASHNEQISPYGSNFTGDNTPWPLNTWMTVDVLVQVKGKNGGKNQGRYRLYVDGVLYLAEDNLNVFLDDKGPGDAKTLNYYVRLMHGGNPDEHFAIQDYEEYFKDLEIYRGTLD